MADRFFCPQLPTQLGDLVELTEDEAHHASRVLRKTSGDRVVLFDGAGGFAPAILVDVRKKGVTAELAGPRTVTPSRAQQLTIATAVPKADRFKWLIEKATELGVDRVIPLACERSVVYPGGSKLEKMRQAIVAACKQSGRNQFMVLAEPTPFEDVLREPGEQRLIADIPEEGNATAIAYDQSSLVLIGPEGGWTDDERRLAREAEFRTIRVGPNTLRTETAAIALAAVLTTVRLN